MQYLNELTHTNLDSIERRFQQKIADQGVYSLNIFFNNQAINCWTDNMLLQYDEKTHTTFNNDGVETRVPGFGNTTTVEYLGHDRLIGKIVYIR